MEVPHLEFELPTSHYHEGEAIPVVMLPAFGGRFDVKITPNLKGASRLAQPIGNRLVIKSGIPRGEYHLKARWTTSKSWRKSWSDWSAPLWFTVHPTIEDLSKICEFDHRLSLMLERGVGGVVTLVDPEAEPPGKVGIANPKWFATPVYEGATPLVNEEKDYFQDPLNYYFDCIDRLLSKGANFLTWRDILDRNCNRSPIEIILQFDVDGGPESMRRVFLGLASRGIRASLMLHRRGHFWYPYELEDIGIDWINEAERIGWCIGYHNNSLSQIIGNRSAEIDEATRRKAEEIFEDDVRFLRQYFDIQTYTHHGGNVHNSMVYQPKGLRITGVDRFTNPDLWQAIRTMFSDGGFISRPTTLRRKVDSLSSGLHFFRNHPFKYANYSHPVDVPPRFKDDFFRARLDIDDHNIAWCRKELEKEACWLQQRQHTRSPIRLNYLRLDKPISSRFKPYSHIKDKVGPLRQRRKESFLRLYPWAEGDPRVFWWRMLEAWAPKSGVFLNVGALPPGQKNEQAAFLSNNVVVKDIDIDPQRLPDFLLDISTIPDSFNNSFAAVMLFGLPYFSSPSIAVDSCARITTPGGTGLFGFTTDTHPARGSIWHPRNRHLWNKSKEPLNNIGLKGNLWAFDQGAIPELFRSWSIVKAEFMGHYWFVVARKETINASWSDIS